MTPIVVPVLFTVLIRKTLMGAKAVFQKHVSTKIKQPFGCGCVFVPKLCLSLER